MLLLVIYAAFVSLGLPDGVFGVAWPAMRYEWNDPLEAAGLVNVVTAGCSALSSSSITTWPNTMPRDT